MRVKVWSADRSEFLGEGTLIGLATVYVISTSEGILSADNAEEKPSLDMLPEGAELIAIPSNPKIELNSGKVVYGCQAWWYRVLEYKPSNN